MMQLYLVQNSCRAGILRKLQTGYLAILMLPAQWIQMVQQAAHKLMIQEYLMEVAVRFSDTSEFQAIFLKLVFDVLLVY